MRVLATEALRSATLHAEGDATQLFVQYLLPLLWLTDGGAAVDWARDHAADRREHKARGGRASGVPAAIGCLKAALRAAADVTPLHLTPHTLYATTTPHTPHLTPHTQYPSTPQVTPLHPSPGRFSNLSLRGRACWASFCDPCVAQYASPSHSPTQRSLDRACVSSFVEIEGEVHALRLGLGLTLSLTLRLRL